MLGQPHPSTHSQRGLDWLNFFIADVETAFGPLVAVYLASYGWAQGEIDTVITINSAVALATQTPAGALVDWTHRKRLIVLLCLACMMTGVLLIVLFPHYLTVMAGEALHGITGGAVRTAIAAIAIGLVGHRAFHTRVGRNHHYASFGNATTAATMGLLGTLISPRAPFFAAAGLCLPAAAALTLIRGKEIDYARARQAESRKEKTFARWHELLRNHALLVFAACLVLFQFVNASMLPLATERLSANHKSESELVTSLLVVVPQLVCGLLAAAWIARKADQWGRRLPLAAVFIAQLVRTVLFALAVSPWFLVAVQVLGGLTATVIGIMTPLVVADCTKRTGRYNFSLGAVSMIAGIGATVSTTATGFVAQTFGFTLGFLVPAVIAACGLALLWFFLPETVQSAREDE